MTSPYKIETDGSISITLNIKLEGNFLEQEERIAEAVAEAGRIASEFGMKAHDTDGHPIIISNKKYTSKGLKKKNTKLPTVK